MDKMSNIEFVVTLIRILDKIKDLICSIRIWNRISIAYKYIVHPLVFVCLEVFVRLMSLIGGCCIYIFFYSI